MSGGLGGKPSRRRIAMPAVVAVVIHRAKLPHPERPAIATEPFLAEEDRAAAVDAHHQRDQRDERR
jgi:hypothetical protein